MPPTLRRVAPLLAGSLLCVASSMALGQTTKPGWELTFSDEFTGTSVDAAKWLKRYKWGEAQINGELQAYVDDAFQFDGDVLHVVGQHAPGQYASQTFDYRSGVLASVFHQKFGRFEIRCRMPAGKGMWPAFWLLGENGTTGVNEIDIHEFLGNGLNTVHLTLHWGTSYSSGHQSDGQSYVGPDFSADYHTFAVDWDAERVIWYVDDVERFRHTGTGVPLVEMYIIANLAIGGNWPGAPDATTVFPASYDIDYVRAYRRVSGAAGAGGSSTAGSSGSDTVNSGGSGTVGASGSGTVGASGSSTVGASASGAVGTGAGGSGAVAQSIAGGTSTGSSGTSEASGCGCRLASDSRKAGDAPWLAALYGAALVGRRWRRRT